MNLHLSQSVVQAPSGFPMPACVSGQIAANKIMSHGINSAIQINVMYSKFVVFFSK